MKSVFIKSALVVAAATVFAGHAIAGDFYFAGSVGSSMPNSSAKNAVDAELRNAGITNFQSSLSNGTGLKLTLGYDISSTFAVEGSYMNLGTIAYSVTSGGQTVNVDLKPTGTNFSLVGKFPMNDSFALMAKAGYTSTRTSLSARSGNSTFSFGDNDSNGGSFGFGGVFKLTESISIRGEWERLYEDLNLATVSLQVKF